jgi:DNA-binding NtrC family response regulator
MTIVERRVGDRRREPRGGRRGSDRAGRAPVVLVADSYESAREPTGAYLARRGFDVVQANTAERAIAALDLKPPRIVVSGLEDVETHRLYERLAARGVPVIVAAASADTPLPVSPAAVVSKPYHLRAVLTVVRQVLRAGGRT